MHSQKLPFYYSKIKSSASPLQREVIRKHVSIESIIDKIKVERELPQIITIERSPKESNNQKKYKEMIQQIPDIDTKPVVVGTFIDEQLYGQFANDFYKYVTQYPNIKWTNANTFFERVISIKTSIEQVTI